MEISEDYGIDAREYADEMLAKSGLSVQYRFDVVETVGDCIMRGGRGSNDKGNVHVDWVRALARMKEKYPKLTINREQLRGQYRRYCKTVTPREATPSIVPMLKSKILVSALAEKLGVTMDSVLADIMRAQLEGYSSIMVWKEEGVLWAWNTQKPTSSNDTVAFGSLYEGHTIQFGVVSDCHFGSRYEALDELNAFYDHCKAIGITTVFNVGDITDGYYNIRPASIFEQFKVGFTEQLDHVEEAYPFREGITTAFITGNHDATHFRNGFADIGKEIAKRRKDMQYLGHNFQRVMLTPRLSLSLVHPADGAARTLSLKLQNLIDSNPSRRADIMLVGHYHKYCGVHYNGVWGYTVPSFQKVTQFMMDNNLVSDVGGLVFTVRVDDDGNMLSIACENVSYEQ